MLRTEGHRLYFDLVKHLTTLSSASILLVAGLGDKLFDRPRGLWLIAAAMRLGSLSKGTSTMSSSHSHWPEVEKLK